MDTNDARRSVISGVGSAVPSKVLTNHDLEGMVDTTDEWIITRTGIRERHIAENGETTVSLALEASQIALDDAGIAAKDLDFILLGTLTNDIGFPSSACLLQEELGASHTAGAMDFNAACSGFVYGVSIADALIRAGTARNVLVVGAETLSKIVDWTDRNTCVLFGDGAGAAIISADESGNGRGVIGTYMRSDGSNPEMLRRWGGGQRKPNGDGDAASFAFIHMDGQDVFKRAVTAMGDAAEYILEQTGYIGDDLDLLVPHQANMRIIQATAKRINLPMEKVYVNLERYGNTSAATIPICLDELKRDGRFNPGELVMLVAFGAGLTWGSVLLRA